MKTLDELLKIYYPSDLERERIRNLVKGWLTQKLDWATKREIYDLANTYKELIEELENETVN